MREMNCDRHWHERGVASRTVNTASTGQMSKRETRHGRLQRSAMTGEEWHTAHSTALLSPVSFDAPRDSLELELLYHYLFSYNNNNFDIRGHRAACH